MSLDFNPNKPAKVKSYFWATYIPNRSPQFKMHSNRGHALNAISWTYRPSILYKWEQGCWVEVFRRDDIDVRNIRCVVCGGSSKSTPPSYPHSHWVEVDGKLDLVHVCHRHKKDLNGAI